MKKIVLIALSALVMACNGVSGDGFRISGEIKGMADGTSVFLEKQDPKTGVVAVDTVKITKGKFIFEGKAKEPEIHSIRFDKTQGGFMVVVERGEIKAVINKDSIQMARVTGTFNNDEIVKYNVDMMKIQKKAMAFQQKNAAQIQAAQQANDTVAMNKMGKEFKKFQDEFAASNFKYIESNPKSFIAVLLIEGMFQQNPDMAKIQKYYDALDSEMKNTKPGKSIKTKLDEQKKSNLKK